MTGKYDELIAGIRHCFSTDATCRSCPLDKCPGEGVWEWAMIALTKQAADAIEALLADNADLNGTVSNLINQIKELGTPRWISVADRLPKMGQDVLVTDGEACAVGNWREDAAAWDSVNFGWLENRNEPPYGIKTVTHWMPLPKSLKEET